MPTIRLMADLCATSSRTLHRQLKNSGVSYRELLDERRVAETLDRRLFDVPTVLLCSEPEPERCHRRLAAEYLAEKWGGLRVVHL